MSKNLLIGFQHVLAIFEYIYNLSGEKTEWDKGQIDTINTSIIKFNMIRQKKRLSGNAHFYKVGY